MRVVAFVAGAMLLLYSFAHADWYSAKTHGVFPYWQTGGVWLTIMVFVNCSDETSDTVYVRMLDSGGGGPGGFPLPPTVVEIAPGEMRVFSTSPSVPLWIPVMSGYGYTLFAIEHGSPVAAFSACVSLSPEGPGYVVPAYNLDEGF